jgi:hypothetical protein
MFCDVLGEARASDEADIQAGRLPAAADKAADRPGAQDRDLGQPRPL